MYHVTLVLLLYVTLIFGAPLLLGKLAQISVFFSSSSLSQATTPSTLACTYLRATDDGDAIVGAPATRRGRKR